VNTAFEIINRYTFAFFDQYLNGNHHDLLEQPSHGFPEADFVYHPLSTAVSVAQLA
jgi:hypothetical protein